MAIQFTHPATTALPEEEQARRKELERLTGCPISKVIDGICSEPDCQNAGLLVNNMVLDAEICAQLKDVATDGQISVPPETSLSPSKKTAGPIIQIKNRLRCVL